MNLDEYTRYDATALIELVGRGEVSAAELAALCLEALEATSPLGLLVANMPEETERMVSESRPGAPLHGLPLLLKDLGGYVANVPQEFGSRLARGCTFDHDAELIARYRSAGAIFMGRTKTPELGLTPTTEPRELGPARNPWDLGRSTGGSSGGSAAAVAAGVVPVAHGTDAAGSLRIPAHCCGVFGLKPSRGRMPRGPMGWGGAVDHAVQHVLSRSVRDSALFLDVTAGPEVGSSYVAMPPSGRYVDHIKAEPRKLRIALTLDHPGGDVDAECREGVTAFAVLMRDLGHEVIETEPTVEWEALERAVLTLVSIAQADAVTKIEQYLEREAGPEDLEPLTWACVAHGRERSVEQMCQAIDFVHGLTFAMSRFLTEFDLWMTVTARTVAPPLGTLHGLHEGVTVEEAIRKIFEFTSHPVLFNLTGQPAMSVPFKGAKSSLPMGVHFAGRHGAEHEMLQLAASIERARPWSGWVPPHGLRR